MKGHFGSFKHYSLTCCFERNTVKEYNCLLRKTSHDRTANYLLKYDPCSLRVSEVEEPSNERSPFFPVRPLCENRLLPTVAPQLPSSRQKGSGELVGVIRSSATPPSSCSVSARIAQQGHSHPWEHRHVHPANLSDASAPCTPDPLYYSRKPNPTTERQLSIRGGQGWIIW